MCLLARESGHGGVEIDGKQRCVVHCVLFVVMMMCLIALFKSEREENIEIEWNSIVAMLVCVQCDVQCEESVCGCRL